MSLRCPLPRVYFIRHKVVCRISQRSPCATTFCPSRKSYAYDCGALLVEAVPSVGALRPNRAGRARLEITYGLSVPSVSQPLPGPEVDRFTDEADGAIAEPHDHAAGMHTPRRNHTPAPIMRAARAASAPA